MLLVGEWKQQRRDFSWNVPHDLFCPKQEAIPQGLLSSLCPWASRGLFVVGLGPPQWMGFPHCLYSLLLPFRGCKTCGRSWVCGIPRKTAYMAACVVLVWGGVGMGRGRKVEKNPLSAMQSLSYFLLPPSPPPFPHILVSPHLCRISGALGSQEVASFCVKDAYWIWQMMIYDRATGMGRGEQSQCLVMDRESVSFPS